MAELTLSDGTRSLELIGTGGTGIWLKQDGLNLPVVGKELTYAESADSEGRRRIRSKPQNAEGSFSVFISHPTDATFWDYVDNLQELVESAHENKGTITYTPPGGTQVTFDLESIQVTGLPQNGVNLRNRLAEVDVSFECLPYGRLPKQSVNLRPGNLVRNPSFEADLAAWARITTGWTGGTSAMTRIANTSLGSNFVMRMTGTKDASGTARTLDAQSDLIPVLPSTSYTLTASSNVIDAATTGNTVLIEWFTSVPASISTSTGTNLTGTGVKAHSLVATSPGSAAFARVSLRSSTSTSGDTLDSYWDAVNLLPTNATSTVTIPGPIGDILVDDVPGQVPAFGELTLTDGSTQVRNHVEVGVQHKYNLSAPEPVQLNAVTQITALAGVSQTRAGSIATNVIRGSVTTSPSAICQAASQPHYGRWKVRVRVQAALAGVSIRLAHRAGSAPFTREKWKRVPGPDTWFDIDLGTVNIPRLSGTHTADFRVEVRTSSTSTNLDVDVMYFEPADGYTRLRGAATLDPPGSAAVAEDNFDAHAAGSLAGKTPTVSTGNWSGAGDVVDFSTGSGVIARAETADAAGIQSGRFAICGTGVVAGVTASVDLVVDPTTTNSTRSAGLLLRYVDINNFLVAYIEQVRVAAGIDGSDPAYAVIAERAASTNTELARVFIGSPPRGGSLTAAMTATVDTAGAVKFYVGLNGETSALRLSTVDSTLATGGALDDGMVGLWDWNPSAAIATRTFDNFTASPMENNLPAINSGRSLTLLHNAAYTQNPAGTQTGLTPIRQGNYLKLPPETRNSTRSRITVKARRVDVDADVAETNTAGTDLAGRTDTLTATLNVTPRVHLISP